MGNSPVPGEFPTQRPVTRSFGDFFDLRLNKRLSKQSWGWWFETLSRSLWRHRNDSWQLHVAWLTIFIVITNNSTTLKIYYKVHNVAIWHNILWNPIRNLVAWIDFCVESTEQEISNLSMNLHIALITFKAELRHIFFIQVRHIYFRHSYSLLINTKQYLPPRNIHVHIRRFLQNLNLCYVLIGFINNF